MCVGWGGGGGLKNYEIMTLQCRLKVEREPPLCSIADVFGPPGSGSISTRNGSGSGSFYQHAKIVRKTWGVPTVL